MTKKLNPKDIERYFKVKNAEGFCPACRQSSLQLATSPDEDTQWALTSARDDGSAVIPAPAVPVLVLVCNHCSYLRLHALIPVQKWIEDNPSPEEKI